MRRCIAALIAGSLAFGVAQIVLGVILGAGWSVAWLSGAAFAVGAGYAAATMKRALAIVYALLAVIWLLIEGLALALATLTPG